LALNSHDSKDGLQRWTLKNGDKDVDLIPQDDKVMRQPQWYDLTDGGRITYNDDKTEIKFGSGEVVDFDKNGIRSVSRDGIRQTLGESSDNKPIPHYHELHHVPEGEHGEYLLPNNSLNIREIMEAIKRQEKLPHQ